MIAILWAILSLLVSFFLFLLGIFFLSVRNSLAATEYTIHWRHRFTLFHYDRLLRSLIKRTTSATWRDNNSTRFHCWKDTKLYLFFLLFFYFSSTLPLFIWLFSSISVSLLYVFWLIHYYVEKILVLLCSITVN